MTRPYADLGAEIMRRVTVSDRGCWIVAASDNDGYQSLSGDYVHRHMYRLHVGLIPSGAEVDHLCFVRACANPAHLEAVTPAENKRRAFAAKTKCSNGHPLPPFEGRKRPCSPCHAARERSRKARIAAGERPPVVIRPELHGTRTAYDYGCRCDPCKESTRLASAVWRASHPGYDGQRRRAMQQAAS